MNSYYTLKDFANVYLEDSFVLKILETESEVIFMLDIVLTENHHLYAAPKTNEQYCYREGRIIFKKSKPIRWLVKSNRPYSDASDTEDYGNIDFFNFSNDEYHLGGDWGELKINSPKVELEFPPQEKAGRTTV